jgi:hypothetical protein
MVHSLKRLRRGSVVLQLDSYLLEPRDDREGTKLHFNALTVSPELIRIIERTVAVDPACSLITRNDKPPYSKVEEIFAALEQVSSVLQVESSDAVG